MHEMDFYGLHKMALTRAFFLQL